MIDFQLPPHRLGTPSAQWLYRAPAGDVLMAVARFETPDGKQILPCIPDGRGGWQWKALSEPRLLYGLDRLAASPSAPVLVCEGEKAADAAQRLFPDHVAITSSGGANAASKTDWTPLVGRDVTIWPDNDQSGCTYAGDVARLVRASSLRIVDVPPHWPQGWDVADALPGGVTLETLNQMLEGANPYTAPAEDDGPAPLVRKVEPATTFPVNALGDVLGSAALAIHDITQAPLAMCGQSVLAAATLAAQGLADVTLPRGGGKGKPLSSFFVTVAATGERKSTVDSLALSAVRDKEADLRKAFGKEYADYDVKVAAWQTAKRKATGGESGRGTKMELAGIEANLRALGDPPLPPLQPMLTCTDPTMEGLGKMMAVAHPSLGVFSAEGGTFIGGYGMGKDNRLKTAAALSNLWDGTPFDRVRALDGASIMVGRRVSMHLMMQPGVAESFLADGQLADQGLLSRLLLAAPDSTAGTRFEHGRTVRPESTAALEVYNAALSTLLEAPLPLAEGQRNELKPSTLTFTLDAADLWVHFHDHIEGQAGDGGSLESIRGLACKAAEHAARIAGVLSLVGNPTATVLEADFVQQACNLMEFYLQEALRLFGKAAVNADLTKAERVRRWLHDQWPEAHVSVTALVQYGPNVVRDSVTARQVLDMLAEAGHVQPMLQPVLVKGKRVRESWRIIGKGAAA